MQYIRHIQGRDHYGLLHKRMVNRAVARAAARGLMEPGGGGGKRWRFRPRSSPTAVAMHGDYPS